MFINLGLELKDEGVKKEKKSKIEGDQMLKSKEGENLKTEKEKRVKTKKGESDEKLQMNKQEEKERLQATSLRNKKPKEEQNKEKELLTKVKVASPKTGMSSSNTDISSNKENKNISDKKKGEGEIKKELEDFEKMQAQHLKEKEESLKKKKQLELEAQKQASLNKKNQLELEAQKEKHKPKRLANEQASSVNLLALVEIKQAPKIRASDIDPKLLQAHKFYHDKSGQKSSCCAVCLDSELDLDVLSLDYTKNLEKDKITDIIIEEKIYKHKPRLMKTKKLEGVPIFYQKDLHIESDQQLKEKVQMTAQTEPVQKNTQSTALKHDAERIDEESNKGIIRYALSDRSFVNKGWTVLPTEEVVRKMNVYRMRPAHPEFDWFENNKKKRLMTYDTGERLAEFDDNGRGRWYYRNGRLALDYYNAEETNAQQRFVVYSSGEPDVCGRTHPITILATFDYLGNGIVFDHAGKIRLKYNQTEGVVLDRAIGPVSHWQWHTLNDPPVLQQVMVETQMANKDPDILKFESSADEKTRPDSEEMLAIEFDNFIKEKNKKLSQNFKPFQIKMKALKINEHFSLKVLDQATVHLIFRDGLTNLKVNMGMILDDKEIVDTETSVVGEVSNSLGRFPARTDSLACLQRTVAHAQQYERQHAERQRRLQRLPLPCASADLLTAATSPPMRLPFRKVPTGSSTTIGYCNCDPSKN